MKKLNVAIIGQGRSGRNIHGAYFLSERNVHFNVAYVAELDADRRERALKDYPGCKVVEDYTTLFECKDIDLFVNATFSDTHASITQDILEHGFNVLVEKPFARTYYECQKMIKTAKDKGVKLAVFQQTFFAPYYVFAKELADSGKLGEIQHISISYNNFVRRWDWQTLQSRVAGSLYNTGPHPVGMALGFLDYDENAELKFSRLSNALGSGDAEDYAKLIITAPGRAVVDIEINPTDAFPGVHLKVCGTRGTFKTDMRSYEMKYIIDGENPERPVVFGSLKDEEGNPAYCSEKLITHEESGSFDGTAFDIGTADLYEMLYKAITEDAPMSVNAEMAAGVIKIIERAHAENPMPVLF